MVAAAMDRGLERGALHRQRLGARQRAEQHGRDHAVGRFRKLRHVAMDDPLGRGLAAFEQCRRIDASVGQRGLLGHCIDAIGRDDEGGFVRRDQSALHGAAGLHQLGRNHNIDVPGHRREAQHRRAGVRLGAGLGKQLDVVVRRAGALGHAWHRGHLCDIARVLCGIDDPFGQHAAAFAAHGEDGDGDRALFGRGRHVRPPQACVRCAVGKTRSPHRERAP
jgi:hypothetical protein